MVAIGTTEVFFSLISMVKKAKSGKDKENEENKSMTFTSYKIRNSFRKKFEWDTIFMFFKIFDIQVWSVFERDKSLSIVKVCSVLSTYG